MSSAERWALGFVLVATAVYAALRFHPFLVPNNDFYTFEEAARQLGQGELPLDSKRLPLFPALVAGLSQLLAGAHPELHAALLWNAAFSIGTLALLFRLGARTLGRGAILLPVLHAASVQFHAAALQPLVEPSLGFSVVLAFVLFQARSPWQYVAAAAAGLGRYEAAALAPLLAVANGVTSRSWPSHLLGGSLALVPLLAWRLGSAVAGVEGGSYLDFMAARGFAPAPGFAARAVAEAFPILHAPPRLLPVVLPLVFVPLLAGLASGLRAFRRETVVLLAFFAVEVAAIVGFGVSKSRYAYPTQWIPLLFWANGAMRLRDEVASRLPARATGLLIAAGALVLVLGVAAGLREMDPRPHAAPVPLDAAYTLALVAAAAPALLGGARVSSRLGATGWASLALVALLVTTAGARKEKALWNIAHANYGSFVLAEWLKGHLGPGESIVVLNPGAVRHLSGVPDERLTSFSHTRADGPRELAAYMRANDIDYAAWTWRRPARSRSARFYYRHKNVELAEHFREGGAVEGFEHVARLAVPPELGQGDTHVYRLAPAAAKP